MKGRESLNARKLRFFVTSARVRSSRGVDSSVPSPTAHQHELRADRTSAVRDEVLHTLTTLWKNVRTTGLSDRGLSPHPSACAWVVDVAHERPSAVVTSTPAWKHAAAAHVLEIPTVTATEFAHARRTWCCNQGPYPYPHRACCSPRMSASFASLRERVKEERDEDESREQEPRARESSRNKRQDADAETGGQPVKDTKTSSQFARISLNVVDEKQQVRIAQDLRGNQAWSDAGWTREEVWNWPNSISMARLVSGPVLAWMIVQNMWSPALLGLIVAGISDWLDGYVARRMEINSVLGSYLDPVADKVLVGSVALSMAYAGLLHPALVGLVVARDGVLVGGAFVYRAYSLRWQWRNWREYFRINVGGAGKVEPLFISKVNTVLQLGLIIVALLQPALSVEDTFSLVPLLSWSVAGTTTISWACYVYKFLKNPDALAALRYVPPTSGDKKSSH
ncbi:cardiolipin synthase (CMP-forming) [Marchantia polymorpha subsp. ruderalis]|uniref:Uncharacterized protein n=1 Tax=Marchantia polymorpha TaxID=3197 RepID=A0A2R6WNC1_MARPO|nr:hypothetical protein MARPO_0072s0085 [Marchantia polymorpha]BBN03305.1 hypothetical protein Mp_2g22460 [Marchantia polymorpha subsp. ruderalis]|eukprot:PTQ35346.1 hypothetical protein MARPO_0072s0085 [Marchantia polymorpha]